MTDSLKKLAEEMRAREAESPTLLFTESAMKKRIAVEQSELFDWAARLDAMRERLLAQCKLVAVVSSPIDPGGTELGRGVARTLKSIAGEAEETE
jgi:hypothetical protein